MELVKENPAIEGSCYVPLNAAIIVTLFVAMGHQPSTKLTGVFVSLVTYSILRHCEGRTDIKILSQLSSLDKLPTRLHRAFDSLCTLVFQGTDRQVDIIHGLLDHSRLTGVFRFYAGITKLSTAGTEKDHYRNGSEIHVQATVELICDASCGKLGTNASGRIASFLGQLETRP